MKEEIYREVNDNMYLRRNDADQGGKEEEGGGERKREGEVGSETDDCEICSSLRNKRNKIWIKVVVRRLIANPLLINRTDSFKFFISNRRTIHREIRKR